MGALRRVLRIQPGEGRTVGLVVTMAFVAIASLTIGESGTNALFFDRIGPDALPIMYVAQGATGLVAVLALTASLTRFAQRRAYVVIPLVVAAIVLLWRAVLVTGVVWIYPVLWVTSSVALIFQSVFVWGTAGLVTDTRRAKRLFPLFGAGGILGAVVGGLVTPSLAATIGADNLLVIWAAGLVCAATLCAVVLGVRGSHRARRAHLRRRPPSVWRNVRDALSFVRRSPLFSWMTIAAVFFSVLFYSLYLPYAQAATAQFPDPEELAGFFGTFWASVTGVAFLVSMLVTNRLFGWLGAASIVVVLPLLYAGAFGILLASSAFATIVAIRFTIGVWLEAVSYPASETVVNVVPETRRDQTRALLIGCTQIGTIVAGLVQLVGKRALGPSQLFLIGLVIAVITVVAALSIRRSYADALVDALRAGRPAVFEGVVRGAPVTVDRDGQALTLALEASRDPDVRVRRLAVETLGAADERARPALIRGMEDEDALVRANAVRGLERYGEVELLAGALDDEDAGVRLAAVSALRTRADDKNVTTRLSDCLEDANPSVVTAAAVALLQRPSREPARDRLQQLLASDNPDTRIAALGQLRDAPPDDVFALASPLLADPVSPVRAMALETLASTGNEAAIPSALDALAEDDPSVRAAAIAALEALGLRGYEPRLREFAEAQVSLAAKDGALADSIPANGEATLLLRDAVLDRGRKRAVAALSALALLSRDRGAIRTALDNLDAADSKQLANALETLEVSTDRPLVRPLLGLWEPSGAGVEAPSSDGWLTSALDDEDPFIRSCAHFVAAAREEGEEMTRSQTSMSAIERVLVLRQIPLFSALSPADLHRLTDIAEERTYADGDVIAAEGELGDELHIIVSGTVKVVRSEPGDDAVVARRGPGDVVGEMSIITRTPRVASLVADGDVRTVRIGNREFESMIRERPEVSLAVMRVLADRLRVSTRQRAVSDSV
jgi:HEAT repeat protein